MNKWLIYNWLSYKNNGEIIKINTTIEEHQIVVLAKKDAINHRYEIYDLIEFLFVFGGYGGNSNISEMHKNKSNL